MISVCIASYNGAKFLREQLESIILQIGIDDEIVISDDCSTDLTRSVIQKYNDKRFKLLDGPCLHSPVANFENALKFATGDIIFLCDQDDVWELDKVKIICDYLNNYDLVVSDCTVVDENLNVILKSFYSKFPPHLGFWKNLAKNHYLGCCMAFRRELLVKALPFPKNIAMHDIWIGLCAEAFFKPIFISNKLIKYRRHGANVSNTTEKSHMNILLRISYRLYFLVHIIKRSFR